METPIWSLVTESILIQNNYNIIISKLLETSLFFPAKNRAAVPNAGSSCIFLRAMIHYRINMKKHTDRLKEEPYESFRYPTAARGAL